MTFFIYLVLEYRVQMKKDQIDFNIRNISFIL